MRQLLVREQCLQREQKLAHSNKQQLPSSLTVPTNSGHHNSSKHEMATTTIAITRPAAASSNSAPRQWQPPTPPPPPPSATSPVVTSPSSLPPPLLSNSRHPKSARGSSPATVAETNQVLRLKNPTTYHVLQSQKRRQELLTSNLAVASASSSSCYDQNACHRGDVLVATASTTRNPEAAVEARGVEAHVGHKHLLYPPKTTTTSAFMTRSAPEILPGEGMSPTSSGLRPLPPPAAETISSAASAASVAALAASASCAVLPTHFSSSAPEPNQVQSQRKNKPDTASASSAAAAAAPKGINYSCGSHAAASPTSIEVRPCHRSFSSKRPRGCARRGC